MKEQSFLNICWVEPVNDYWAQCIKREGHAFSCEKGYQVVREGDIVDKVYYLETGLARYTMNDINGRSRTIGFLLPGSIFGEGPIILQAPITMGVQAMKDCTFYYIPRNKVISMIYQDPELSIEIIRNVTLKFRNLLKCFSLLSFVTPEQRLIYFWSSILKTRQHEVFEQWHRLPVDLSQEQLGEVIGANRVTVCRIIAKWKKESRLKIINKAIYVHTDLVKLN